MSEPFLGEIKLFPFPFAPQGWALCDGAILQIATNQPLYSLLGATYGGNGTTTFALPDLRGRVPVHVDYRQASVSLGQRAGEESHTLSLAEMPMHTHTVIASNQNATLKGATADVWAKTATNIYGTNYTLQMNSEAVSSAGSGLPHPNMQPYLVLNFCIAITGIYPSRP